MFMECSDIIFSNLGVIPSSNQLEMWVEEIVDTGDGGRGVAN